MSGRQNRKSKDASSYEVTWVKMIAQVISGDTKTLMAFTWEEGCREVPLSTGLFFRCFDLGSNILERVRLFVYLCQLVPFSRQLWQVSFRIVCILRPSPWSLYQLLKPKGLFFFLNPSRLSAGTSSNTNYNLQRHVYSFCSWILYTSICL